MFIAETRKNQRLRNIHQRIQNFCRYLAFYRCFHSDLFMYLLWHEHFCIISIWKMQFHRSTSLKYKFFMRSVEPCWTVSKTHVSTFSWMKTIRLDITAEIVCVGSNWVRVWFMLISNQIPPTHQFLSMFVLLAWTLNDTIGLKTPTTTIQKKINNNKKGS